MLITKDDDGTAGTKPASRTGQGAASLIPHLNNDPAFVIAPLDGDVDISAPAAPPPMDGPEEPVA
ncbi:MAG: hypothetical protein V4684_20115 [Pseudomonadota bacterium]